MDDEFDPYWKWLGIPPEEQPPNHYRLLGIALFEEDPDVINNAADRQMAHLRTFQTGKRAAMSQELLNELSAAKVCLLDPARKRTYDAAVKGGSRESPPSVAAPAPVRAVVRPVGPSGGPTVVAPGRPVGVAPRPVTAVATEDPIDLPRPMTSSLPRVRRRSSQSPIVGVVLAVAMLVVLGLIVWSMNERPPSERSDDSRSSSTAVKKTSKPIADDVEAAKNGGTQWKKDPRIKIRPRKAPDSVTPVRGFDEAKKEQPATPAADSPAKTAPSPSREPEPGKPNSKPDKTKKPDTETTKPKPETPSVVAKRIPWPAKALVERAYRISHPTYKQAISDAKTPAKKLELAKELQAKAETEPDAPTQAALWELARNLAVLAADPSAVCDVVDTLAARFEVDPYEHKRQALDEINKLVLKPDEYRKVLPVCKRLIGEALSKERYDAAVSLAKVAKIAAGKTKDMIDIKEANAQLEDVSELERIVQNFKKFDKQLTENPDNDVANLHAGRYWLIVRGDWQKGVAALAKCNDSKLADLAKRDIAGSSEPAAQLTLADAWLEQAKRRGSVYRQPFAGRARHWYQLAETNADGEDKETIAGKLTEVDAVLKAGL